MDLVERLANRSAVYQRYQLAKAVGEWLQMGGTELLFTWSRSGRSIGLIGTTFGTLAVQLMFAVSRSQALAICSGCGQPYLREEENPTEGEEELLSVLR